MKAYRNWDAVLMDIVSLWIVRSLHSPRRHPVFVLLYVLVLAYIFGMPRVSGVAIDVNVYAVVTAPLLLYGIAKLWLHVMHD